MTDKTHQLIGLTAATAGFFAMHPSDEVTWGIAGTILAGSFLGSILPDIDQPTSGFWEAVPLGDYVGRIVPKTLGGHRNLSHSILGFALFNWLIGWFVITVFRDGLFDVDIFMDSFRLGFIAHLAADAVTVQGIPLLWPLGKNMGFPPRPFEGIRIVTGKWFEHLVVLPTVLVGYIYLLSLHAPQLCQIAPFACPAG
ncbi:metal-dependent hydrolase [Candidatus Berkelbacteria bacterium]|nr:metal-dependent hydrolase [Candidatus Berkelbacteria bacterium]